MPRHKSTFVIEVKDGETWRQVVPPAEPEVAGTAQAIRILRRLASPGRYRVIQVKRELVLTVRDVKAVSIG